MAQQNDEFLKKLLATFQIEADEHLETMSSGLFELGKLPAGNLHQEVIEKIFREAHSLKGAARAVKHKQIEAACQSLESVFSELKGERLAVTPPLLDLLHQTVDAVAGLVGHTPDSTESRLVTIAPLIRHLEDAMHGRFSEPDAVQQTHAVPEVAASVVSPMPPNLISETVRVSAQKLDVVMRQVEELLSPRLASVQRARELRETATSFATWKKQRARIRPVLRLLKRYVEGGDKGNSVARGLQELPKLLEYLETEQLFMKTLEGRLLNLSKLAERDQRMLAGMADSLLDGVKEMQLMPFASLLETFPRFTRELAREQGKQVELVIKGSEFEIDRRILQEMKDPLMHMLRNCIDHGIETPEVRQGKGKTSRGTITVAIEQKDSGKIEILLADDGAGIDANKVLAAARKLGMVSAEQAEKLSEQEAQALIFQSGVSTSMIITDVSGRGLGLAIVREKVEQLGGTVVLDTHANAGTTSRISLPLTLATLRGVLVQAGEQGFVIPSPSVERVTRISRDDIQTVENRETITLGGQAVALVRLGDVLELPGQNSTVEPQAKIPVVVLGTGHSHIAFCVDAVVGEQEVLVKPLGPQLARVRNVAGASVLGDGRVVPVLNVSDLLKSAVQQGTTSRMPAVQEPLGAVEKRSILVVEDSITSRALLKNILESGGYRVTTAVDGVDAYTVLKTEPFDLVVSDVEMPRMDGFDLTAKVRADKQLMDLPVVLVTALGSREHRERGIDAGANAYIIKSSFDQSNLLETVQRLIGATS